MWHKDMLNWKINVYNPEGDMLKKVYAITITEKGTINFIIQMFPSSRDAFAVHDVIHRWKGEEQR